MAAVVYVNPTPTALLALLHETVDERAAVVTPRGMEVGGGPERVGGWCLAGREEEREGARGKREGGGGGGGGGEREQDERGGEEGGM